jgi:hypothetical protein
MNHHFYFIHLSFFPLVLVLWFCLMFLYYHFAYRIGWFPSTVRLFYYLFKSFKPNLVSALYILKHLFLKEIPLAQGPCSCTFCRQRIVMVHFQIQIWVSGEGTYLMFGIFVTFSFIRLRVTITFYCFRLS